ncbi:DUF2913 family protein, partial [Salmonella enterica]
SYAPVRARLVREPYRRIRKTSGYAGGYLLALMSLVLLRMNKDSSYNNIGHLAWCALVALGFQRHDRLVVTEAQENIFLIRWLADARKQKRFPRNLTEYIDWLLAQGRRLGVRARLNQKLHYLWLMSSGDLHNMPDLLRLTYAIM